MRDIKFRAWGVKEKRMFWPRVLEYAPAVGFWVVSENKFMQRSTTKFKRKADLIAPLNSTNPESAVLMQYTGLKDKNGVEIYEGDILRVPPMFDYEKTTYNCYEVFWHDNDSCESHVGWQMNRMHTQGNSAGGYSSPQFKPSVTKQFEVIGNIYEHPELAS